MTTTSSTTPPTTYGTVTYEEIFKEVTAASTRPERAALLDELADTCDNNGDATFGRLPQDSPEGDTLAWHDIAGLVRRLAAAERNDNLTTPGSDAGDNEAADYEEWSLWEELGTSGTREEHAQAAEGIVARLNAALRADPPALRRFTVEKFTLIIQAVTAGYPETLPTETSWHATRASRAGAALMGLFSSSAPAQDADDSAVVDPTWQPGMSEPAGIRDAYDRLMNATGGVRTE